MRLPSTHRPPRAISNSPSSSPASAAITSSRSGCPSCSGAMVNRMGGGATQDLASLPPPGSRTLNVLLAVILQVLAAFDRSPAGLVLHKPAHRQLQRLVERV